MDSKKTQAAMMAGSSAVFFALILFSNMNEYNYLAFGLVTAIFSVPAFLLLKGKLPVWTLLVLPAVYLLALLSLALR